MSGLSFVVFMPSENTTIILDTLPPRFEASRAVCMIASYTRLPPVSDLYAWSSAHWSLFKSRVGPVNRFSLLAKP